MSEKQISFSVWNREVAALLVQLNNPRLPTLIGSSIKELVAFEHMMIFGYRSKGRPLDLYNPGDSDYRQLIVQNYIAGSYLLDPFYLRFTTGDLGSGFHALSEVKPDDFKESEYNLTHYGWTGIFDEVVCYVPLEDGLTAAMSLTRGRGDKPFTKTEKALLDDIAPVIAVLIQHYWSGDQNQGDDPNTSPSLSTLQLHIQNTFQQFGRSVLTEREAEIIGLIMQGFSSFAVSEKLEIAVGTVKIHRRNAYQKLKISSQNELFAMFLESLSDPETLIEQSDCIGGLG